MLYVIYSILKYIILYTYLSCLFFSSQPAFCWPLLAQRATPPKVITLPELDCSADAPFLSHGQLWVRTSGEQGRRPSPPCFHSLCLECCRNARLQHWKCFCTGRLEFHIKKSQAKPTGTFRALPRIAQQLVKPTGTFRALPRIAHSKSVHTKHTHIASGSVGLSEMPSCKDARATCKDWYAWPKLVAPPCVESATGMW